MAGLDFKKDVLPFITATAGEFLALYYWLQFWDDGNRVLASIVLWAGFLVERISVYLWLQLVYRPKEGVASQATPLWQTALGLIAITLTEILIWVLWLWLADDVNFWLAAGVLLVLMLGEHSWEMSLVKKTKPLSYVTDRKTIFYTLIETAGGVAWLWLVRDGEPLWGGLILLAALSVEHVLQGSQLKPDVSNEAPTPAV